MLTLNNHGGKCCGIKTLLNFGYYDSPSDFVSSVAKKPFSRADSNGYDVSSDKPFFSDAAPWETCAERLDRLIEFCKKKRPQGCIEATLAKSGSCSWDQIKTWGPTLEERGFKQTVPPFLNSNSSNYVAIYHLVYDATIEPKVVPSSNPFGRSE